MKKGIAPSEVAKLFYKYLQQKNYEKWLLTFRKYHQDQAERYGSSPDLYWRAGQKMQEKYGYVYKHVPEKDTQLDESRWKFFFQRYRSDGKKSGSPAPITIIRDEELDGEWRVDVATV
ncbi:MAG: hypothetical protein Q6364_04530 [Candidatus Hermodarchaeota archaeon]|nr:hypothetical protein [Candidatus Hermodarchaeota archaeon]